MFTRASATSYVCLHCQYKSAFREAPKIKRNSVQNTVWRRWQSASAVAKSQENDDDADESVVNNVTEPPTDDRRTTRYRHWQPPPTADLGVNVLGKPAEILVLPQEGRRRRQRNERILAEGDGKDDVVSAPDPQAKPQLSVSDALAKERRPASQSEVTENIERLRTELEKPTEELDPDKRQKCEKALASGFSRAQLERYISTKGTVSPRQGHLQSSSKKALVAMILDRIWGIDIGTPKKDSMDPIAAYVPVSAEKYELLRMNGTYAACQSTFSNTTLRYDSVKARLSIYGSDADIKKIKNIFGPNSTVVTRTVALTSGLDRILRTSSTDRSRLQETMRKHSVLAKEIKGSRKFQCWAFSEMKLQKFERDLILWQAEKQTRSPELPPLSLEPLEHASKMPTYHSGREYHRYILPVSSSIDDASSTAVSQSGKTLHEVLRNLQESVQAGKATHLDYNVQSVANSRSERFSSKYSAELGQAMFRQHKPEEVHVNSPTQHTIPASVFLAKAPLLPQFLAQHQSSETTAFSSATDATAWDTGLRHVRISLRPAEPEVHPAIELRATLNPDSPLSLNITGVALILTQLSQILLLPSTTIDLQVSRKDKYVLLGNGLPIQQPYAPLLAQIAAQLVRSDVASDEKRHAGGRTRLDRNISLLLNLDLSCFKHSITEAEGASLDQTQSKASDLENSDAGPSSKVKSKSLQKPQFQVRYALESVETIDAAVYQTPTTDLSAATTEGKVPNSRLDSGASRPLLEHLILTRIGSSQDQNLTEMVRVVEQPLVDNSSREVASVSESSLGDETISDDSERFQALIRSAYGTAMEYKRFVMDRTKLAD